jgi:hypothetical protein
MSEHDSIIDALEQSVQRLDADAGSVPTPEFRARCRARVIKATSKGHLSIRLPVSRRFAAVALATCLSLLLVIPALAGPGGVSGTMSTVATGMRHMFGPPANPNAFVLESSDPFGTPGATPTHPDNHGADVSAVAKATPQPGENHGEQVRDVARDNHGHNKGTPTATSGDQTATETSEAVTPSATSASSTATEISGTATATSNSATATETTTSDDSGASANQNTQNTDNHGSDVSSAAQQTPETPHGEDVSSAAQSTPEAGENHGQQVKDVATDNHGHDVSSVAHGTSTPAPEAAPETTPETTPEAAPVTTPTTGGANNHSHGGGKGHGGD